MTSTKHSVYLLTGDIGGTNSRMRLYDTSCCNTAMSEPLVQKQYNNAEHIPEQLCHDQPDLFLRKIVIPFLQYCWEKASTNYKLAPLETVHIVAALATAGIVSNNQVRLTNLGSLLVDGTAIEKDNTNKYLKTIVVCRILNDFVAVKNCYRVHGNEFLYCCKASFFSTHNFYFVIIVSQQGYGCLTLKKDEVCHLYGPSDLDKLPVGPKVCIGAGTGLGECYLTPNMRTLNDDRTTITTTTYQCFPSEGGHVEYAPRYDLEVEMFEYLSKKFSSKHRISVERVVSGKGLANVYEFLAHKNPSLIQPAVHDQFVNANDEQGKVVAMNAVEEGSLCAMAMEIMMSAYGCEAGSAAIKWIPFGGLFITGGITPKNIKYIEGTDTPFMRSYLNKGRVSTLLEDIPCFAVLVEDLGERGAHKAALMEYATYMETQGNKSKSRWIRFLENNNGMMASFVTVVTIGVTLGVLISKRI